MSQPRIPATVITGFLGSGKTTLIRNIIMQANGKRLALIVNEFGEIGMDGDGDGHVRRGRAPDLPCPAPKLHP